MDKKRAVVHVELYTKDRLKVGEFFNKAFGWDIENLGEPMPYTTYRTGNVEGGISDVVEGTNQGDVILYVESEDIEVDLKMIESLGGKVERPKAEIPGIGWFGQFRDPGGNLMALFSPPEEEA
jgi:predicted enzyme related to lactoylglutathione lyase